MGKKSLVKNYFYNLAYQILILILPLITTPYIARTLGAEAIGIYGFTYSIATYFIMFGVLGMSWYAQREVAYVQEDKGKRSKLFYEIIILRAITMTISMILFYIFYVRGNQYNLYYAILMIELLSTVLDISWFFTGLEDFKKTVIRNLIVKFLFVVLIFILIKSPSDLYKYFLIISVSNLIGNISLWSYMPKLITKVKIKELNIFRHLKPTIILFIPQIAVQVYTVLDRTMIGYIIPDKSEVGYYEQAQKLVKVMLTIVCSLSTVMMPRMATLYANDNKEEFRQALYRSIKFVYILALPIIAGLILIADVFVPFFLGEGFDKVILLVKVMAPIILFIGLTNIIGFQFFVTTKQSNRLTLSVVVGAIINFILNIFLINKCASLGASISTTLAECSVLVCQLYMIRKEFDLKIIIKWLKNPIIATASMSIISYLFAGCFKDEILGMACEVLVGIIVYFMTLVILKDDFLKELFDKLGEKINFINKVTKIIWK